MGGSIEKYATYFNEPVEKQHAFGQISPADCKLPIEEFALIKGHFPDIKIILLLRNPVDRLWSQICFSENAETLEELEQKIEGPFQNDVYLDPFDYVSTIHNIRSFFT